MSFKDVVTDVSQALSLMSPAVGRYKFEPYILGDQFPALSVQYRADDTTEAGADEEYLPNQLVFNVRVYYPIRTVDDDRDGLEVAQEVCLDTDSGFRDDLANDPTLGGRVLFASVVSGRAFGIEDDDQGNLYVHELTVLVNVH